MVEDSRNSLNTSMLCCLHRSQWPNLKDRILDVRVTFAHVLPIRENFSCRINWPVISLSEIQRKAGKFSGQCILRRNWYSLSIIRLFQKTRFSFPLTAVLLNCSILTAFHESKNRVYWTITLECLSNCRQTYKGNTREWSVFSSSFIWDHSLVHVKVIYWPMQTNLALFRS